MTLASSTSPVIPETNNAALAQHRTNIREKGVLGGNVLLLSFNVRTNPSNAGLCAANMLMGTADK
jgi:hypothetical protein